MISSFTLTYPLLMRTLDTLIDAHYCTCRVKEFAPTEDEKWVQEFEKQMSSQGRSLASVAKEMTETVTDPEITATEVSFCLLW